MGKLQFTTYSNSWKIFVPAFNCQRFFDRLSWPFSSIKKIKGKIDRWIRHGTSEIRIFGEYIFVWKFVLVRISDFSEKDFFGHLQTIPFSWDTLWLVILCVSDFKGNCTLSHCASTWFWCSVYVIFLDSSGSCICVSTSVYRIISHFYIYGYLKYHQEVKRFAFETGDLDSNLWNSVSHSDCKLFKIYAHTHTHTHVI